MDGLEGSNMPSSFLKEIESYFKTKIEKSGEHMNKSKTYPFKFTIVALVLYIVFFFAPAILGIYYSLTDWNAYSKDIHFVGIKNYIDMLTSNQHYFDTIKNTVMFTVVSNIVKLIPALALAIMLQENLKGRNVYRTVFFLPSVLPFLIIGLTFRSILHPSNGLINHFLINVGLENLTRSWLIDLKTVWPSIFTVDAWRGIGYCMTIFLAGLQTIPTSYYEASDIDGANYFQKLKYITLPMISPSIMVNLVFGITYGLKAFDIIFVLTKGGPGRATDLVTTAVFSTYSSGNYGLATALNTVLFMITMIIGVLIVWRMSKLEVQQ